MYQPAVLLLLASLLLGACASTGQSADPVAGVAYERTSRLVEMRASLAEKNARYEAQVGDRLNRNTNKRQMGDLVDEHANWDRRAQAQIERELLRRYQQGDAAAVFPGIEKLASPDANTTPTPASTP